MRKEGGGSFNIIYIYTYMHIHAPMHNNDWYMLQHLLPRNADERCTDQIVHVHALREHTGTSIAFEDICSSNSTTRTASLSAVAQVRLLACCGQYICRERQRDIGKERDREREREVERERERARAREREHARARARGIVRANR